MVACANRPFSAILTAFSMKPLPWRIALTSLALIFTLAAAEGQTPYRVGDIVTNTLAMQTRLRWTNDNGQVFTPSNTIVRLSDFDGKLVFYCMFDVW